MMMMVSGHVLRASAVCPLDPSTVPARRRSSRSPGFMSFQAQRWLGTSWPWALPKESFGHHRKFPHFFDNIFLPNTHIDTEGTGGLSDQSAFSPRRSGETAMKQKDNGAAVAYAKLPVIKLPSPRRRNGRNALGSDGGRGGNGLGGGGSTHLSLPGHPRR